MAGTETYGVTLTQPWAHQSRGYKFLQNHKAAGLWFDMGTGKSKIAVDYIRNSGAMRTLILCPKSVMSVWPGQFNTHCADPKPRIEVLNKGTVEEKAKYLKSIIKNDEPIVVVVNYDAARMWPLGPRTKRRSKHRDNHGILINTKWDIVICDEIHRIKAHNSIVSHFAWFLGEKAKRRIGLSGTPIPHSPLDAFGVYRFLDPAIFGTYYTPFRARYAILYGPNRNWVKDYQNLRDLKDKMGTISITVKADDVLDLPETRDMWLWCQLCPEARKLYDELEKELCAEWEGGDITISNALVKLLRLQQISCGAIKIDNGKMFEVDHGKFRILNELLEDLPKSEPVVVFARFTHDLELVRRACFDSRKEEFKRPYRELSGRINELKEWQEATKGGVLGVQIQAGGVGIDLTRSRYCVYFSTGFSLEHYLQSRARTHRPGQDRKVIYYHLGAENTIDSTIADALKKKEDLVNSVLSQLGKD